MGLKNILVHLDTQAHTEQRLECSLALARQHGARIIGLFVVTHPLLSPAEQDAISAEWQLKEMFERKVTQAGIIAELQRVDVNVLQRSVAEVVNHYACFADLVVVGQADYRSRHKFGTTDLPARVILGSGRPVLIMPYAGTFGLVGESTLVAWKAGRESTRALSDALPILKRSGQAQIFEVNPTEQGRGDLDRLCAHLADHGVCARAETSIVTEIGIGDVLLNRVADGGNDLLVMGAYAYTHFGTYVLGDIARHILRHMTVPVIMSH
jgi:nucleotide-binding universal stress UspA family protein